MKGFPGGGLLVFAAGGLLAACSGSSDPGSLTQSIPVTRPTCTPFGDLPRPVQPENALFHPTCLLTGKRLDDYTDANGTPRQACLFEPAAAAPDHKLPLVVFVHPSLAGPDLAGSATALRLQLETADLSGDPNRPGFILLEPAGRITERYYPVPDQGYSPGWDNWYRQFATGTRRVNGGDYPENVDAATIDHFIAEELATGKVDEKRIYVMGWSNGSAMGILYALNRPNVAAAAVYSAPDPLAAFNDPCEQTPVAGAPKNDTELQVLNPGVPIFHVHNSCDVAGLCPNGLRMESRLTAAGVPFKGLIIDDLKRPTEACEAICGTDPNATPAGLTDPTGYLTNLPGYTLGTMNHLTWPYSYTDQMFEFLRTHPKSP
jgi:predicted esterase